tara:strand:- start:16415 stop:17749 length:1335 start_codon:yes stop_codon:yes gene_type:complete
MGHYKRCLEQQELEERDGQAAASSGADNLSMDVLAQPRMYPQSEHACQTIESLDNSEEDIITQGMAASRGWKAQFETTLVHLARDSPEPFTAMRRLGGGGEGIIHETRLADVPLAWKRTYTKRLGGRALNEVAIMANLSGQRHKHIVQLIGAYTHQQRRGYEIGLLIFPVAHCDLAALLHDMDNLGSWIERGSEVSRIKQEQLQDGALSAVEMLSTFSSKTLTPLSIHSEEDIQALWKVLQQYLCRSFVCMTQAVAYLHRNQIRHKDLKPSQFLLSPNGLWLTDFGWSTDTSALSHSATSNGDNITFRYQAPERAMKGSCSRSEDVFSLGCTFLEMGIHLTESRDWPRQDSRIMAGAKWSFQNNLAEIKTWLLPFSGDRDRRLPLLARIIEQMMQREPKNRPTIDRIIEAFSYKDFADASRSECYGSFFELCCKPLEGPWTESE